MRHEDNIIILKIGQYFTLIFMARLVQNNKTYTREY